VYFASRFCEKSEQNYCRIALDKDCGHYLRAILCLFCPDFPQIRAQLIYLGLIRSIVYIAKELDLEVVVEGIEDERQRQFIESVGCHLGQGYGYCRPQSVEEATSLLQAQSLQHCIAV